MKKRAKKVKKETTLSSRILLLGVLIISLAGMFVFRSGYQLKSVITPTPTIPFNTPTPTLTPTITPTPSPTPIPGYCLYVPILLYHHVQPQQQAIDRKQTNLSVDNNTFDAQMSYLQSQGYTTITAKQLIDALIAKSSVPLKSIMLTFDDGYKDNFEYAHPVLQKYGLTGNLMISSGLIGGADYLSWDQVRQMSSSGRWYFTNHTWSHFSLGNGSVDKITYEVTTAKQQIEQNTGQTVDVFTYPYGTVAGVSTLQSLGVRGAFSTIPGRMQCDSILFALRRNRVGNSSLSSYGL